MWTVIYVATDEDNAKVVENAIKSEGILAKTREVLKSKRHGCCIEILVPETEAQEAQEVILEKNL
ncbi:MAG TPA: hypothetical protein GX534_06970 [Thermoanaerobacterales bacterium]|jgi:hypothetical protein|nr:hypothetical protein [Thermoanaerobacterales bacterium]